MKAAHFRVVLWAAGLANVFAAMVFGFPASDLGSQAGLPLSVPVIYRELVALFILLFAGMYAWLARAPRIEPSMVALGAIGKALAVASVFALWLSAQCSLRCLAFISGDLLFAVLFAVWLRRPL